MNFIQNVEKKMDFSSIAFLYRRFYVPLVCAVIVLANLCASAQSRTVGVLSMTGDTSSGYTFFAPIQSNTSYLVDNFGRQVHSWTSSAATPASTFLLPDGSILRCESLQNFSFNSGGSAGRIKRISWDGQTNWTYDYSSSNYCQHHGFLYMPNGNVLLIAWELKSEEEASAVGRNTSGGGFGGFFGSGVWPCHIVEVQPSGSNGGTIIWEWHAWDHIIQDRDPSKDNYGVVEDHPELIDVNYTDGAESSMSQSDWLHTNNVSYNEELDQIMLSVRYFNEVWIIDHSTTTEEAASHSGGRYGKGGDLLYRFGNPAAYKSGSSADRTLYLQHDAHWIADGLPGAGNVLVFNNGASSRNYSSVDEFRLPVDEFGNYDMDQEPENVWSYTDDGFFASNMSSAQRMENGNTLICHGPKGTLFEIDTDGDMVWEYVIPVTNSGIVEQYGTIRGGMSMPNQVFRANRHAPDYAAFNNRNMEPADSPLEGGQLVDVKPGETVIKSSSGNVQVTKEFSLSSFTNPIHRASATKISISIPRNTDVTMKIYNADGREVTTLVNQYLSAGKYGYMWNTSGLPGGMYFVKLVANNFSAANRIVLLH